LTFIVRVFVNDSIAVAVWTSFDTIRHSILEAQCSAKRSPGRVATKQFRPRLPVEEMAPHHLQNDHTLLGENKKPGRLLQHRASGASSRDRAD
jgi:hypothetical protein